MPTFSSAEELVALARQIREADRRGERLGLREEELAFYDALAASKDAAVALGEPALRTIAQEPPAERTCERDRGLDGAGERHG